MDNKIKDAIHFYVLCNKLKDTIRTGYKVWNIQRDRVESVAEHIYGTQMLALAIYYQFGYKLDIKKILCMLAIHELEEVVIGDLVYYEISSEEKKEKGHKACEELLKDILNKEEILSLVYEFDARETEEAKFAYHIDKLECDIQVKLYDQENCFDLNNQPNNILMNNPSVRSNLAKEKCFSNSWIEFDRSKYQDDRVFIDIINWLKDNEI